MSRAESEPINDEVTPYQILGGIVEKLTANFISGKEDQFQQYGLEVSTRFNFERGEAKKIISLNTTDWSLNLEIVARGRGKILLIGNKFDPKTLEKISNIIGEII